jgi:uncharacterized protein YjlB
MGKRPSRKFLDTITQVEMPEIDPLYGKEGPLAQLWYHHPEAKL